MFLAIFGQSCNKENILTDVESAESYKTSIDSTNLYSIEEIRDIFSATEYMDWKVVKDAKLIYSLAIYTGSDVAIGFQPKNSTYDLTKDMARLNLNSSEWQEPYNKVLNTILTEEKVEKTAFLKKDMKYVPNITAKVTKLSTIENLLALDEIRYIEPLGDYSFARSMIYAPSPVWVSEELESIACDCTVPPPYNPNDAEIIDNGNAIYPWNYNYQNVNPDAWNISTGENIGVAVFDTGLSDNQENLGSDFNSGLSSGRIVERYDILRRQIVTTNNTSYDPSGIGTIYTQDEEEIITTPNPHDNCGHGTRMAGLIAAPRGTDGNTVGVAYNCNLYSYRVVHNPLINLQSEKEAVAEAFNLVASRDDIHIISMSLGIYPGSSYPAIEDAINNAATAGKLIFVAAGTSLPLTNWLGVVFPANLTNTFAITGIKEPLSYPNSLPIGDSDGMACSNCHYGNEVDFAVIMERSSDAARTSLAVTCSGDIPAYSNGSSCSTATFAGMAALVWAKQGTDVSSGTIMSSLIQSSSNNFIDHPDFGFGWVDMNTALQF